MGRLLGSGLSSNTDLRSIPIIVNCVGRVGSLTGRFPGAVGTLGMTRRGLLCRRRGVTNENNIRVADDVVRRWTSTRSVPSSAKDLT